MKVIVTSLEGGESYVHEFDADSWNATSSLRLFNGGKLVAEFAPHTWISVRVSP
ncbi:hypothetical protein [Burkholderia latens]|uniref:hypothetical protein n=1 Tax=Burkholderia latens TaxID=488446 RepID=UPI001AE2AF0E|nr:hypothetical protein [Burkholderia latens]QTO46332.1 hypothetical protein J8I85_17955 [Burkholderia latens]